MEFYSEAFVTTTFGIGTIKDVVYFTQANAKPA